MAACERDGGGEYEQSPTAVLVLRDGVRFFVDETMMITWRMVTPSQQITCVCMIYCACVWCFVSFVCGVRHACGSVSDVQLKRCMRAVASTHAGGV